MRRVLVRMASEIIERAADGPLVVVGIQRRGVQLADRLIGMVEQGLERPVRRGVLDRCRNRDASFLDAVLDGVFTVPGDGMVDYLRVLAPLAAAGYSGWLVVEAEQDAVVAPSFAYASKGFKHLHSVSASLFQ